MPSLILDGQIFEDQWVYLEKAEAADQQQVPEGKVVVPLATWLAQKDSLSSRADIGVWLDSDEEPEALADHISELALIAVNFPKFADGRGYSIARLIRERHSYQGELRAMGDVLLDQLFYMKRCGFNSFALRPDRSAEKALAGLTTFTEVYQAGTDQPLPLFRRRA
ncbi:oxidoreductase [Hahella sp. CCB-MM4]|uniref:DUF934 domain-containing protein n=1 Tax=Hahella sp. (strain CCB-MM4) TaxID=1926491 RepID=UPI000B9C0F62|nr:DUF934 domain-containing protein [Hahella sp. CCB-MM4]OZG73629.1 oxidoreductase [Hahella sp. CCB-MM4]